MRSSEAVSQPRHGHVAAALVVLMMPPPLLSEYAKSGSKCPVSTCNCRAFGVANSCWHSAHSQANTRLCAAAESVGGLSVVTVADELAGAVGTAGGPVPLEDTESRGGVSTADGEEEAAVAELHRSDLPAANWLVSNERRVKDAAELFDDMESEHMSVKWTPLDGNPLVVNSEKEADFVRGDPGVGGQSDFVFVYIKNNKKMRTTLNNF